jgi:hypothetical protein
MEEHLNPGEAKQPQGTLGRGIRHSARVIPQGKAASPLRVDGQGLRSLLLQELLLCCYLAVTRAAAESVEASCAYFY